MKYLKQLEEEMERCIEALNEPSNRIDFRDWTRRLEVLKDEYKEEIEVMMLDGYDFTREDLFHLTRFLITN